MFSEYFLPILAILMFGLQFVCTSSPLCPDYCKCDIYKGRNHADCSGKRLINPYVDLSAMVEVLDLSYNDIAIIDDDCFQNYHYLINLTIAHNDVHTIYLDAFVLLNRLRSVDLSYNRLEYIDERLFEANHQLLLLNLEGNKFVSLPSRPLLRSTSLCTLNLRNAGINHITPELLTALPQLTELDLSQNLIITLSTASFNALKHLKSLILDENPWICDKAMVKSLSIMRHRAINISVAECDAAYYEWQRQLPLRTNNKSGSGQVQKFERLQSQPSPDQIETISNNNKTVNESTKALNWRNLSTENVDNDESIRFDEQKLYDADDDTIDFSTYIGDKQTPRSRLSLLGIKVDEKLCEGTRQNLCRRYRNCLQQVSHVLIKKLEEFPEKDKTTTTNESKNYTENEMYLAFMLGNVVGIAAFVFLFTCVMLVRGICKTFKHKKDRNDLEDVYESLHSMQTTNDEIAPPVRTATALNSPAPFPTRRSRRPRRQPVRHIEHQIVHHENGSNSFVGRLLGRPARRQYYRATATLIRSLSRTSLFNVQREQNNTTRAHQAALHSPTTASAPLNRDRPETPPPNYGDIITKE